MWLQLPIMHNKKSFQKTATSLPEQRWVTPWPWKPLKVVFS
jgi:hypothetical protein